MRLKDRAGPDCIRAAPLMRVPLFLLTLVLMGGCAHRVADAELETDPWEGFNRKVFAFNNTVDQYAYKPAARAYLKVTPNWLNESINRFFNNLSDLRSGVNGILQWRWSVAGQNLGRFTVNSTLGVAGLFDVAGPLGSGFRADHGALGCGQWALYRHALHGAGHDPLHRRPGAGLLALGAQLC